MTISSQRLMFRSRTCISKRTVINDEIQTLRQRAMQALSSRRDVIRRCKRILHLWARLARILQMFSLGVDSGT